jgi:hypothetical protein
LAEIWPNLCERIEEWSHIWTIAGKLLMKMLSSTQMGQPAWKKLAM